MFMVVHRYFLESPKSEHLTFKLIFTNSGFSRNTTGKEKAKAFNVVNKVESHDWRTSRLRGILRILNCVQKKVKKKQS